MTIYSSTPAAQEVTTEPPMNPARRKQIVEYVTRIVRERAAAGFTPDGRLLDMAKYSVYLRTQRESGKLLQNDHL